MRTSPLQIESSIAQLPKIELHVHLEGSVRPETLRELACSKGKDERQVERWLAERERTGYRYPTFRDFLEAYTFVTLHLETPADYALATERLIEQFALQNVKYAEVTLSAGVLLWKKQRVEPVFEAIAEAAEKAGRRHGVRVNWIFDSIRHFGVEHAREVLAVAAKCRSQGVVAFGIGGDEARGPAAQFRDVYREARELGLHTTAHAGETQGPDSVRDAVLLLAAERIGHGLSAARDLEVIKLLAERQVAVEACPSSNVSTGVLARLEDHPLARFLQAGLRVTLNSDDPAMFGTSLEREFTLAATRLGATRDDLVRMSENAIQAAFLPPAERDALLAGLFKAVTSLGIAPSR